MDRNRTIGERDVYFDGYLISQFLSPLTDRRIDRWGGNLENRMRFVIEVYRAARKQVGEDFPVMIKLGCKDYVTGDNGLKVEESGKRREQIHAH